MAKPLPFVPAPPRNPRGRVSSDQAWPLRDSEGRTWAERKALEQAKTRRADSN